jgi:hypothetical protein
LTTGTVPGETSHKINAIRPFPLRELLLRAPYRRECRVRAKQRPAGPPPIPRRKLNQPAFYDAVRACGLTGLTLGPLVGFRQSQGFSALARAVSVPAGSIHVERLEKIADIIGFDKSQLFVEGGDQ